MKTVVQNRGRKMRYVFIVILIAFLMSGCSDDGGTSGGSDDVVDLTGDWHCTETRSDGNTSHYDANLINNGIWVASKSGKNINNGNWNITSEKILELYTAVGGLVVTSPEGSYSSNFIEGENTSKQITLYCTR